MTGEWPFPGENALIRSRKMALAYRQLSKELATKLDELRSACTNIDPRIVAWIEDDDTRQILADNRKFDDNEDVAELDRRFQSWGESWHTDVPADYEPDDYVTGTVGARLIQVGTNSIRRYRLEGKLHAEWRKLPNSNGHGWWYRVGDLYKLRETMPGRDWRRKAVKDTVGDSGRSDAE